jgi:hypothetical protein
MKTIILSVTALVLSGCYHLPPPVSLDHLPAKRQQIAIAKDADFRDKTLMQPNVYFEETPQSRSIIVGSGITARMNGCTFMQRYRINTNADFTGSMNLIRYRSSLMGGRWLSIVHHGEIDVLEGASHIGENVVYLRDGTDLGSSRYLTTIVGDLFDCPCDTKTCSK